MLKLFLWLRYLRKKKIVFLSIAAVSLSSALLIVVSSLFTSFINAFEQSAVEAMGDIVLDPPIRFAKYQLFIDRLEQVGQVKAATATLSGQGLLHLGEGNVRAVKLLGIEPESRAEVTGFKQFLYTQKDLPQVPSLEVPDSPESVGGFVGIGVVAEPDEKTDEYDFAAVEKMVGRQVPLTTGAVSRVQENESTGAQFTRKTVKLTIVDIVFTGVYELDKSYVYLPIERLQKILYPNEDGQVADQIQIKVASEAGTDSALAQIRGVWVDFADKQLDWSPYLINETTIKTSKEMHSPLVAAFKKQMGILILIFGVVSFTVVLLVFCILYMIVTIKQKDIAIIKSCGATNSSVALIFVSFGAFVGIVGSGMGAIMGYIVTKNINTIEELIRIIFGLKLWKSSVYMFSKIPNEVDWFWAMCFVLSAIIAASLGALLPAIIAVKTRPINILRYE